MLSTAVWARRVIALLAWAVPMMIGIRGQSEDEAAKSGKSQGSRLPVLANFAACSLFFSLLIVAPGGGERPIHVILALGGATLALVGSAVVLRSRAELGAAWTFVPKAVEQSGIVTTGPYRLVRHPIHLGLSMLALGQSLAFCSGPASLAVVGAVVPSFLWRAQAEEKLLIRVFGERHL
jgi:protein-S-isoprenylcysteine O-methyltransferase Ste14